MASVTLLLWLISSRTAIDDALTVASDGTIGTIIERRGVTQAAAADVLEIH
jgi:hypothetical protein